MMSRLVAAFVGVVALGLLLLTEVAGAGRSRTEDHPTRPPQAILPSSGALQSMYAPVLSGLDYTAVAPPGSRIRVVEDEPFIYLLGSSQFNGKCDRLGLTSIILRSDLSEQSWYEARVILRYEPSIDKRHVLRESFDDAAHSAYTHAMLRDESRGADVYSICELRSPLGLTDADDKQNNWREYLIYDAAAINPNSENFGERATPYTYISGDLRVLRMVRGNDYLLTVQFKASDYAFATTLTENIARCIINRLDPKMKEKEWLPYLAYYPEYETAKPYFEGEPIDPRTADLMERPGEGCGLEPQQITGDVCPECTGEEPYWPAAPYKDPEHGHKLNPYKTGRFCSHCLLTPWVMVDTPMGPKVPMIIDGMRPSPDCGCPTCLKHRPDCKHGSCTGRPCNWEGGMDIPYCDPCYRKKLECENPCQSCNTPCRGAKSATDEPGSDGETVEPAEPEPATTSDAADAATEPEFTPPDLAAEGGNATSGS